MTSIDTLRLRACWSEAAATLEASAKTDPTAAVERAAVLVERSMYTGEHWADADNAVLHAEKLAEQDALPQADAALARSYLAYSKRMHGVNDLSTEQAIQAHTQADPDRSQLRSAQVTLAEIRHSNNLNKEAVDAINLADDLLPPDSPRRGLLLLRTALIQCNIIPQASESVATLRSAHEQAVAADDSWLLAQTTRLQAVQAYTGGDNETANRLLVESLRYTEASGWLVELAPALAQLALTVEPAEAKRLRAEATRLFTALGGVPVWLRDTVSNTSGEPNSVSAESPDPDAGELSADGGLPRTVLVPRARNVTDNRRSSSRAHTA